jgi:hypothetical protein
MKHELGQMRTQGSGAIVHELCLYSINPPGLSVAKSTIRY